VSVTSLLHSKICSMLFVILQVDPLHAKLRPLSKLDRDLDLKQRMAKSTGFVVGF
jgi:hypothetical protein